MSGTKKTQAETTAATAAAVEARAAASKAKEGSKEPVAYVGPDIKNVAINGTVYIDGLPEPLQEKIGDVPAHLIIYIMPFPPSCRSSRKTDKEEKTRWHITTE